MIMLTPPPRWKSEIETKALTPRKVLIYWGQKRTGSPSQLKQYDVVITTYGILNAEHGAEVRLCPLFRTLSLADKTE